MSRRILRRHRWTGRYEAHLWDKGSWNPTQRKKGKQGIVLVSCFLYVYICYIFSFTDFYGFFVYGLGYELDLQSVCFGAVYLGEYFVH